MRWSPTSQYFLLLFSILFAQNDSFGLSSHPWYRKPPQGKRSHHQQRLRLHQLYGVLAPSMFENETQSGPSHDDVVDDEEDYEKYHSNEPTWAEMFPKFTAETHQPEMLRDAPDWESLEPDDPLFLDMPWPEERGPEASAFARHMQWKRSLTDQERKQWQKYAVYNRVMMPDKFDYCLEDYILQSLIRDCKLKALEAASTSASPSSLSSSESTISSSESSPLVSSLDKPPPLSSALWATIPYAYHLEEEDEIRAVIGAFYSAFNRKNFDAMRQLWLPDETVELILPGYNPVRGHNEVDKLYKRCVHNARPFGSISHEIKNVMTAGYVAIVYSIETIGKGTDLQNIRTRRGVYADSEDADEEDASKLEPKRVFTLFMLRKWNKQWRIMNQYSSVFKVSTLAGDDISKYKEESEKKKTTRDKLSDLKERLGNLSAADRNNIRREVANKVKKIVEQGNRGLIVEQNNEDLFPGIPDQVKEALDKGETLSILNDEGELVVVGNSLPSENSGSKLKKTSNDEDVDLSNRRIIQNSDGSYTVSEELSSVTNSNDEEGDHERELLYVLEGNEKVVISLSRLTIEALRRLVRENVITKEQKTFFLMRMVLGSTSCDEEESDVVRNQESDIEIAFKLIVLGSIDTEKNPLVRDESGQIVWNMEDLIDFAEQCMHIYDKQVAVRNKK